MESDNNSKSLKVLQINMKEITERTAMINGIAEIIKEGSQAFLEFGRANYEIAKNEFQSYLEELKFQLMKLDDIESKCIYLVKEKGVFEEKIIEAKSNRDGFNRKLYKKIIDEILEPYFNRFEAELKSKLIISSLSNKKVEAISFPENIKDNQLLETENSVEKQILRKKTNEPADSFSKLPPEFRQITCHATEEQIMDYFMILAKEKNEKGIFYMKESDVEELVKKNFAVFNSVPTNKYFSINLNGKQKSILQYFVVQFYRKAEYSPQVVQKYANFLIHNFELFKENNLKNLTTNFVPTEIPRNHIPVEKYFSQKHFTVK